jgi:hypothetical protein
MADAFAAGPGSADFAAGGGEDDAPGDGDDDDDEDGDDDVDDDDDEYDDGGDAWSFLHAVIDWRTQATTRAVSLSMTNTSSTSMPSLHDARSRACGHRRVQVNPMAATVVAGWTVVVGHA